MQTEAPCSGPGDRHVDRKHTLPKKPDLQQHW